MKKAKYELAGKVTFGFLFKSLSWFVFQFSVVRHALPREIDGKWWKMIQKLGDDAYRDSE